MYKFTRRNNTTFELTDEEYEKRGKWLLEAYSLENAAQIIKVERIEEKEIEK